MKIKSVFLLINYMHKLKNTQEKRREQRRGRDILNLIDNYMHKLKNKQKKREASKDETKMY